ncbi:hypothetical protein DFO77_13124 [Marinilabilia salmonicolor]|uniref:Uncharacterized protein n=2 Tax=Marinilabilia salmonicolor TaxID=989 RepID=A0A368UKB6_9BACT|nr:hypothetical protein DFO77_13124 [Marinilabilia salmonicolor]
MKKCSTMDLDFIISKSYYLQELLLNLPEARLKEVLISPRREIVENLKKHLRIMAEMNN